MRVRKLAVEVDAFLWQENGDHPDDNYSEDKEGEVVRYFRDGTPRDVQCKHCDRLMHDHGWIDTLEGGHVVCPGDYIITGVEGERYPCKPDIFWKTYEKVED
jgi:hypothetical protein